MMTYYTSLGPQRKPSAWTGALLAWRRANLRSHILAGLVGVGIGLLCLISPWLAVGVVLGVTSCIVALSKPIVLCYVVVAVIALTSGMKRGQLFPLLRPNEVGLFLSGGVAFLVILANKRRHITGSRYGSTAFIVLISGTVIIPVVFYLLRGTQLTTDDAFRLLAPLQYFLLFWLFAALPESESDRRKLIQCMLLCGSIVAAVGLMQMASVGFVTELLDRWYASSLGAVATAAGRTTSLMAAWNVLGIYLMVNLLIAWAILPSISEVLSRVSMLVTITLSAACLVASGSFAGILGLITGVLVIEVLRRRRMREVPILRLAVAGVAIGICSFQPILQPLIRQRLDFQFRHGGMVPQTLLFRFQVWRDIFWPPIRQNFPWPVHPTIPATFAWQFGESQYLMLLFHTGFVSLLAHLAWVGITLAWLYRRLRKSDGFLRAIVASTFAILVVLSIAGLTNSVFTYSGAADYLWIMLALVAGSKEVS